MKPVERAPGYFVTPAGLVFSGVHNWRGYGLRQLRHDLNDDGYPSVRVSVNGKRTRLAIHRLVADAFLPPRPSQQHEVRHLNGDRLDCRVENLAWGTRQDNADDRERHGHTARGPRLAAAVARGRPAVSPCKGRPLSAEHRQKISEAKRGRPWTAARRNSQ